MRELDERYAEEDVVVIGIHTPEFDYEKNVDRVKAEKEKHGLTYPTVIDNDWVIWRAYENHYWPALYMIDKQGRIREHHRGELHVGTRGWEKWITVIEELRAEG